MIGVSDVAKVVVFWAVFLAFLLFLVLAMISDAVMRISRSLKR